jgi:hypothetical protein
MFRLHGLVRIIWDMRRWDQTSLGPSLRPDLYRPGFQPAGNLSTKSRQTRLSIAYDARKPVEGRP